GCETGVKHGERRAELLRPLLARRLLITVRELLAADARERRLVGEGLVPVGGARKVKSKIAKRGDVVGEEAGFGDLRDLDHLGVALLRGLAPEGGEVGRNREAIEDFALFRLELGDLGR